MRGRRAQREDGGARGGRPSAASRPGGPGPDPWPGPGRGAQARAHEVIRHLGSGPHTSELHSQVVLAHAVQAGAAQAHGARPDVRQHRGQDAGLEANAALQRAGAARAWAAGHGAAAAFLAAVPAPAEARRQPAAREPAAPQALQKPHHPRLQDPGRGGGQHVTGASTAVGFGARIVW